MKFTSKLHEPEAFGELSRLVLLQFVVGLIGALVPTTILTSILFTKYRTAELSWRQTFFFYVGGPCIVAITGLLVWWVCYLLLKGRMRTARRRQHEVMLQTFATSPAAFTDPCDEDCSEVGSISLPCESEYSQSDLRRAACRAWAKVVVPELV